MTFTLLSVVIIGVTAAIIYKQTRKGYKHGLSRSLTHLATLLCCAIFSAPIATLLAKWLGKLLFNWLSEKGTLDFMDGVLSHLTVIVQLLLTMILSVVLYLPVFLLVKILMTRLHRLLTGIMLARSKRGVKKKEPQYLSEEAPFYVRHDKRIAAWVGGFTGLLIAVVLFMPMIGILKTADDIVDTVAEMTHNETILEKESVKLLDKYANDAGSTVMRACGGKVLYDMTARVSYEGHSTYMNKEIKIIREMNIVDRLKDFQASGQLSVSNSDKIYSLLEELEKSLCLKVMMTEFLKGASENWMMYEPFFGIDRPSLGNYRAIDDLFDSILFVCSTTNVDNYDGDVKTILNLVGILSEYQTIFDNNDYDSFMKEFVEGDALEKIEDELSKNPRMSALNVAVDGMLMNLIATELSLLEYDDDSSPEIYQGLADVMNSTLALEGSVKMTAVANGVSENFAEYNVYLPSSMEDRVASILITNVPSNEVATEESVKEIFEGYIRDTNE